MLAFLSVSDKMKQTMVGKFTLIAKLHNNAKSAYEKQN
jgi:hypothetical protein